MYMLGQIYTLVDKKDWMARAIPYFINYANLNPRGRCRDRSSNF